MDPKKNAVEPIMKRESSHTMIAIKDRIIAGARKRFFTHGLRGVTMDDLAEELGVSKKTLYAHFPSKVALLEAALIAKFQEIETELESVTSATSSDFRVSLQKLLSCFQRHTEEIQPPFMRDVQREASGMFELVEVRRRAIVQRYLGRFLSDGQAAGVVRDDIGVGMMIEIILAAVEAIMNPPKLNELGLTLKSGFSAIITVFLEGVIIQKGSQEHEG